MNQSNPRQLRLLDTVRSRGAASVEELAEMLGVTLQTVRRDVQRLADAGLLARFHGGVRVPGSTTQNLGRPQRESLNAQGKARIAQAVAARVPSHCSLMLNIGTTAEAIARALLSHQGLTVITNNLHVAHILADNPACEVIVAGGSVRARDRAVVGEAAIDFLRQFKVDIALLGCSGIEADASVRDFDLREVKVAQAILAQGRQAWLAADASKFNRAAMVEVAPLSRFDCLITDAAPPAAFAPLLEAAGLECVVAAQQQPLTPT